MTKAEAPGGATDPFELWRQMYETNERAWSEALEQAVSSPEFGESSGKMLETMLAAQKSVRDNMRTYLETMNLPTREDIARLGELVVGLEEKVDQLGDRLDGIEEAVRGRPWGTTGVGPTESEEPEAQAKRTRAAAPPKSPKPPRTAKGAKPAKPVGSAR